MERPDKEVLQKLYWDDWLSQTEVANSLGTTRHFVGIWLREYAIPQRVSEANKSRSIWENNGHVSWNIYIAGKTVAEHRYIVEKEMGIELSPEQEVHHKDGNSLNNHPINLQVVSKEEHKDLHNTALARPPWFYNHMVYANLIAGSSTCERLKVGCVITSFDLEQIYAIGINGNAKKLKNKCDGEEVGKCGCVHAENNALIKVGIRDPKKVVFITHSPCLSCAKLIINSGASYVYYAKAYRDTLPLKILHYNNIRTCPYPIRVEGEDSCGRGYNFETDWKEIFASSKSI
jgi:dCMP deaminase